MAISYYDEAVLNKIKRWVKDPKMKITSPEETRRLFQYIADESRDEQITLPLIALRRGRDIRLLNRSKRPLTFDGVTLAATTGKVMSLSAIPIDIDYQIDIYTRYAEEADEYVRNFVFNIINYPKITVTIPYNGVNYEHDSNMRLINDIEDNSDIPERLIPGQFTRYTLSFNVDDAYLFSVPMRDALAIEVETEVKLQNESNIEIDGEEY